MNTKRVTGIVIVATAVALILYDIWVLIEPTPADSISAIINQISMGHPAIPFAFGFLCGHWFWPLTDRETE